MIKPRANKYFQTSWVVPDLYAAIDHWVTNLNVGPFFVFPHVPLSGYKYRGRPFDLDESAAVAQAGDMQIEFIEVHSLELNPYSEVVPRGQMGFHHLAAVAQDLDAEVAEYLARGYQVLAEGDTGGVRFAMIDTWAKHGCMTELLGAHPMVEASARLIAEAARDWDGQNAVRQLA